MNASMSPLMFVLFVFFSCTSHVCGYADWFTKDYCTRKLFVGQVIMNNKAVASQERYVRVYRGTKELKSGDVYQPSESLTVSINDAKDQYVYEVSEGGAKFEKGGCEGRRIADKPKVTLVMPAKGAASTSEFEIVTAWATGHDAVKISLPFRLISAESTTQREALVTKSKSKLSVMSRKKLDQDTEEEPEDHHAGRVDEHHHDERHLHEDHEHEEAEHHHDERHLHEDREHEENQYHHDQLNHDIQHKHDQWHLGQEEEEDYHDEQYRLHQHDHEEPEYRHDRVIPHHEIEARLHDPFNHAHDPFSHHGHDVFADEPFAHHPHDHDHNHGDLAHLDQHHQHQQPETAHIPNEHLPIPHDALPHHLLQQPGLLHKHILSQQQQLHNMFTHTSEEQLVPAPTEEGNKEDVESAAYRHHHHHTMTAEEKLKHAISSSLQGAIGLRGGPEQRKPGEGNNRLWEWLGFVAAALLIFGISRIVANRHKLKRYFLRKQGYDLDK